MTSMLSITTATTTTAITRAVLSSADEEEVGGVGEEEEVGGVGEEVGGVGEEEEVGGVGEEEEVGGVGEEVGGVREEEVGLDTVAKDEEWDGSKCTAVENFNMDDGEGTEGIWVDVGREVVELGAVAKDEE